MLIPFADFLNHKENAVSHDLINVDFEQNVHHKYGSYKI
jgi:hypothetical protein